MLRRIEDLPHDVIGLEASGKITGADYDEVLAPAVNELRRDHHKIRLLYVLGPGFEGYTAGGMSHDAMLGLKHPRSWEKIAVVTDDEWVRKSVDWLGWMVPGDVKLFHFGDEPRAREWICN